MKKIVLLLFLLLSAPVFSQCLKADVIFMLDWSGSEDSNRVYIPIAAYDFVNTLQLGPSSVKIGIIPFNESPMCGYCLPPSTSKDTITSLLFSLMSTEPDGGTSFPSSFELADFYFDRSEALRGEPVMRILIFISDGDEDFLSRSSTLIMTSIMRAKKTHIWCISTPNAFGSEDDRERRHLQMISSGPGYFLEEYYMDLREELLRLNLCP